MNGIEFHPVAAVHWPDLAQFFEHNGNPNYCWCMRWRMPSSAFSQDDASGRRQKLEKLVHENTPVGVVAYDRDQAVGWCSVAPRETCEALERSRVLKRIDEQPVWSVVCFFIDRRYRNRGLAGRLLEAAVAYARSQGATIVEGYPVPPDKSYRFMGSPSVFEKVDFREVRVASNGRKIVRLHLNDAIE